MLVLKMSSLFNRKDLADRYLSFIYVLLIAAFFPTFFNGFQKEWDDQWMVMNPLTTTKTYNNLNK